MSRAAEVNVTGYPCAASHSPTVLRSATSARSTATTSDSRAVITLSGRPSRKLAVPHRQRREAEPQQPLLTWPAFAVRGQHAARHPRCTRLIAAMHAHGPAIERGAACDRKADDAAADDGQ